MYAWDRRTGESLPNYIKRLENVIRTPESSLHRKIFGFQYHDALRQANSQLGAETPSDENSGKVE